MADYSDSGSPQIQFQFHQGAVNLREYPFRTGYRKLPYTLLQQIQGGHYRLDRPGHAWTIISPGEAFLVPAGVEHQLKIPEPGRNAVSIWLHFSCTAFEGIDLYAFPDTPSVFPKEIGGELGGIIAGLANAQRSQNRLQKSARIQEYGYRLNSLLLELLPETAEQFASPGFNRILPVLAYIRKHFTATLNRDILAAQAHLSPTRFHYVFKEATGMAPMAYVRELRLNRAKELLIQGDMTVYEIAAAAGFEDPYYFSRIFHRTQGLTPTDYRRQVAGLIRETRASS